MVGLLASEVCTRGGVQSFMLRIADVIDSMLVDGKAGVGYCFSLNDSTDTLSRHPAMPSSLVVRGAERSKRRFVAHAIKDAPRTDQLIVGHLGLAPVAWLMRRFGRTRRYHLILHGIEAWKRATFIDRYALMGAESIIATTRYTARECARHNGVSEERFHVIPLCADERDIEPSPDFSLRGEFRLLCVARQDSSERDKGFEHVFEAIARLVHSHPGIHLNLVGKGDDQERLKGEVKDLGIEDRVTFWNALSDEELQAAYRQCDVFVMPSRKEGFGIVFLEAMRHGKPCIGGNYGGTPEVIEHGESGYLVEYEDVIALCKFLNRLVRDEVERGRLGQRGIELIEHKFGLPGFRQNYRSMLAEKE